MRIYDLYKKYEYSDISDLLFKHYRTNDIHKTGKSSYEVFNNYYSDIVILARSLDFSESESTETLSQDKYLDASFNLPKLPRNLAIPIINRTGELEYFDFECSWPERTLVLTISNHLLKHYCEKSILASIFDEMIMQGGYQKIMHDNSQFMEEVEATSFENIERLLKDCKSKRSKNKMSYDSNKSLIKKLEVILAHRACYLDLRKMTSQSNENDLLFKSINTKGFGVAITKEGDLFCCYKVRSGKLCELIISDHNKEKVLKDFSHWSSVISNIIFD